MTLDELNDLEKEISLVEIKTEEELDFALSKEKSVIYVKANYTGQEIMARRKFYQFLKGETPYFRENIFVIDIEKMSYIFGDKSLFKNDIFLNLKKELPSYPGKFSYPDSGTFIFFHKKEIVDYELSLIHI